jgi:two-component system nitrate/nitrite response regulator NarL
MKIFSNSVLIIDDHPLFRKGVRQLIETQGDLEVVSESASGDEGIEIAKKLKPDLILLDLNMKKMDGFQTLKILKETDLDFLVIILTVSDAEQDLVTAVQLGADGYLLKDSEPEDMLSKIRAAAKGEIVLDDTLTSILTRALRENRRHPPVNKSTLTDREAEILTLISEGMCNKVIANNLSITDGTVKVHVKNILRKLNFKSRLEAAVWAIEHRGH